MFIELSCNCMSTFNVDVDDDNIAVLSWAQRFIIAHEVCGFMAPEKKETVEETHVVDLRITEGK